MAITLAVPTVVMAGLTTVFSDNFSTDGSLQAGWYNMNNSPSQLTGVFTPGTGLVFNQSASGSGKINEEFNVFTGSPVSLINVGDYITLTVVFNSPILSANNGSLLAGLFSANGTPASGNLQGNVTTGNTADDKGYFGFVGFNSTSGNSTKFFNRNGGTIGSVANELGYYSSMSAGTYTQNLTVFANSAMANLANNQNYTLHFTVTKTATGNTITESIDGTSDNFTVGDPATANNTFDELNFGFYTKSPAMSGNAGTIVSAQVDFFTNVPEPSTFALAGLGMLGLALMRRIRR
jgi:VCBS repeat-containing protein